MSIPPEAWSYYEGTVRRPDFADLPDGDVQAEVCIVGGGLTGVSVALELAEQGVDVRLIDAGRIGGGASGRNGGQINTGLAPGVRPGIGTGTVRPVGTGDPADRRAGGAVPYRL